MKATEQQRSAQGWGRGGGWGGGGVGGGDGKSSENIILHSKHI